MTEDRRIDYQLLSKGEQQFGIHRARVKATRRVLASLQDERPFVVSPLLVERMHTSVRHLTRLPEEANPPYQFILALHNASFQAANSFTTREIVQAVQAQKEQTDDESTECTKLPSDVLHEILDKSDHYRFLMKQTFERAAEQIAELSDLPNNQRALVERYLQVQAREEATALLR